jgi:hypothetical protein
VKNQVDSEAQLIFYNTYRSSRPSSRGNLSDDDALSGTSRFENREDCSPESLVHT